MKKPTKRILKRVDHFINALKAFKNGAQLQVKSREYPDWRDVDLTERIDARAVQYRVKPGS